MKRNLVLVLVAALIGSFLATMPPAEAAEPFENVYAEDARLICHLPRSGNNQRVVGFDTGFSFVHNGVAYWSYGDSLVDGNGDGMFGGPGDKFGFRTGTVGRVTDLNANNCINIQLRTTNGRNVLPPFPADETVGECLIWPNRTFEAAGRMFFFYTSVRRADCKEDGPTAYVQMLGELKNPNTSDLQPVRVGEGIGYGSPIKGGGRIYFFNQEGGNLYLARVPEERVTNVNRYQYWTGADDTWSGEEADAQPIAVGLPHDPTVAYNDYVGRYMMVYTCGFWNRALCARTAKTAGPAQTALFSGWNSETEIYSCAYFGCGHGYWHAGYKDPANPQRIFVSSAHFPGREYFVTLKSIDLRETPAPASHSYWESERDFGAPAGTTPWSAASYDIAAPGLGLTELTTLGHSPADIAGWRLSARVGFETVDGDAAPGVTANGVFPSGTRGAGRVWTAPAAGVAAVSGEAWIESTLGDGAMGEVWLVGADGNVTRLWQKPLAAKWQKTRTKRLVNLQDIPMQAGDQLVIGVRKGRSPLKSATADFTFFPVSVSFVAL